MSVGSIVVPLDGSAQALAALPVAHALAEVARATVRVLHVAATVAPPEQALRSLGLDPQQLRGALLEQRTGDPADAIVQATRERSDAMIAMCTCTGAARPSHPVGPVAERVLAESAVPVVLVAPRQRAAGFRLRHVLLPHDGTPTTSAADCPAAELASAAGARLSALHVAVADRGAAAPAEPGSFAIGPYADQPQHEWPEWADEFIARLTCLCPIDRTLLRLHVAHGDPASEIVRFAAVQNVDLIVLAWRGSVDPGRAGVIRAVLRDAACPAMIVRAGA